MNNPSRLRQLIAVLEEESAQTPQSEKFQASWSEMVKLMDLGLEPQLRACPVCGRFGMLLATRCGYCWSSLVAPVSEETSAAS
jgi:hypothetical protein